jgi:hypothetical protein
MAETVGSIVDKISILELKIYHMAEQLGRRDVDKKHRIEVKGRLLVLKKQKADLEDELSVLLSDLAAGKAKLKIYRQFKMYNDPKYRTKND